MKCLILAAGFGTRLRPITNNRPKPLCPFFGIPTLEIALHQGEKASLDIAVNTHYLSEQMETYLHTRTLSNKLKLSIETEILGTGGALNPIRDWIGNSSLLLYNSDIVCDLDIESLIFSHKRSGALATMVMIDHRPYSTPVYVSDQSVDHIGNLNESNKPKYTFSGIHIVSSEFIDMVPKEGFHNIIDTYQHCLSNNYRVNCYIHEGYWADLGTPRNLWEAHYEIMKNSNRDSMMDSIGIYSIREKLNLPKIHFNNQTCSAYAGHEQNLSLHSNSYIESSRLINNKVEDSIVVTNHLDHHESISKCILVECDRVGF